MRFARTAVVGIICGLASTFVPGVALADALGDAVLLNPVRYTIKVGRYSPLAAFKVGLGRALDACGAPTVSRGSSADEPGQFEPSMAIAIQALVRCPIMKDLPADSPARRGALTVAVWRAVMGQTPPPTVEDRTRAMILSFEATDFGDPPEWNLCQDGTRARFGPSNRKRGSFQCFNGSDPCSFMTWGPRGATAGAGREIQFVLWMVDKIEPDALKRAFGDEYDNMRRFIDLKGSETEDCRDPSAVKRFVCAVWLDGTRRQIWESALVSIGQNDTVRRSYDELYSFKEFDGAKLVDYYDLWQRLRLTPSEVDYAFFMDRITHHGGPPEDAPRTAQSLSVCIGQERGQLTPNAAARRCLSRLQPHKTQPGLRLARDVAYYLDGYAERTLAAKEIEAWGGYIPLSATFNFALSDAVPYPLPASTSIVTLGEDRPIGRRTDVTPQEMQACPAEVLSPIRGRR